MPGVFEVSRHVPMAAAIEDIWLRVECSLEGEGEVRHFTVRYETPFPLTRKRPNL